MSIKLVKRTKGDERKTVLLFSAEGRSFCVSPFAFLLVFLVLCLPCVVVRSVFALAFVSVARSRFWGGFSFPDEECFFRRMLFRLTPHDDTYTPPSDAVSRMTHLKGVESA